MRQQFLKGMVDALHKRTQMRALASKSVAPGGTYVSAGVRLDCSSGTIWVHWGPSRVHRWIHRNPLGPTRFHHWTHMGPVGCTSRPIWVRWVPVGCSSGPVWVCCVPAAEVSSPLPRRCQIRICLQPFALLGSPNRPPQYTHMGMLGSW